MNIPKYQRIYLDINSWNGISIGATHFYGELLCFDGAGLKKVTVTHKMTSKMAKELSKKDDWHYKPGEETHRFSDKEQIIDKAKEIWKREFPNGRVLFLGSGSSIEPKQILDTSFDCNPILLSKVNEIADTYPDLDKSLADNECGWRIRYTVNDVWEVLVDTLCGSRKVEDASVETDSIINGIIQEDKNK